jgi:hypothetical protein
VGHDIEGFVCGTCGERHTGLPLAFSVPTPLHYEEVPAWLRWYRCRSLGDPREPEFWIIDEKHFYLRGQLEVPITDTDGVFSWGVWVSVSTNSFERMLEIWDTPGSETERPIFGWLAVVLPLYPDTLNLKTSVHTRPVGRRPFVELEHTGHSLALEQRNGITMSRATDIATSLLHRLDRS